MGVDMCFSGGLIVKVPTTNAVGLMQTLNNARDHAAVPTPQGRLPTGWAPVESDDGLVYVNPQQVAYLRDYDAG